MSGSTASSPEARRRSSATASRAATRAGGVRRSHENARRTPGGMKNDRLRFRLQLIGSLLSIVVAAAAALGMRDRVRMVDILALFAGGVGAGVALAQMAQAVRERRNRPPR